MGEIKNYGNCEFCGCVMTSDLSGDVCPSCLKKWDPVEHLFDEEAEEASVALMQNSVDENKDSHGYEWPVEKVNLDDIRNYKEFNMLSRLANENKENPLIRALQARRSEALQMAYYTCHKLGHFSDTCLGGSNFETLEEKQRSKKAQFLSNVEEVKELARNNMDFIIEG